MPTSHIPAGFRTLTPYLIVNGAKPLLQFLQHAFDAKIISCTEQPGGVIMHSTVKIGDSVLELSEARAGCPPTTAAVHVYVPDTDATYAQAIRAGATSFYEPATRFYGDREAGVKDACGNTWFIATHIEDVAPAEIEKRAAMARG
jgi:PhnB protein